MAQTLIRPDQVTVVPTNKSIPILLSTYTTLNVVSNSNTRTQIGGCNLISIGANDAIMWHCFGTLLHNATATITFSVNDHVGLIATSPAITPTNSATARGFDWIGVTKNNNSLSAQTCTFVVNMSNTVTGGTGTRSDAEPSGLDVTLYVQFSVASASLVLSEFYINFYLLRAT